MDCPQCGRPGFMPETPCMECGYEIQDGVHPGDASADMSLDELNRMLGELGIEPISNVGPGTGENSVTKHTGERGMQPGRTEKPGLPEEAGGAEEASLPVEISLPDEVSQTDEAGGSEEIMEKEAAVLMPAGFPPDEGFQPESIPTDENNAQDVSDKSFTLVTDGMDRYAGDGVLSNEKIDILPPPAGKNPSRKHRLKDARHMANPTLAAMNFFKALIGWLPALPANRKADRRKQTATGIQPPKNAIMPDSESAIMPNPESAIMPPTGDESIPGVEGGVPSVPADMESFIRKDNSLRVPVEQDVGTSEMEMAALLGTGAEDEKDIGAAGTAVGPSKVRRIEAKPLSDRMKNLIFWVAVPLVLVMLVAALLQFVLGLRERRVEAGLPVESEAWRYEPWSPQEDAPPVPVSIKAAEGVYLP